jgi:hypothetical protein
MSIEIQTDETIELKSLVQDLAKRLASAVVIFESCDPPLNCGVDRKLLGRAQALAPSNDKMVRLVSRT